MSFSVEQLKAFRSACEQYRKENASVDDVYFALTGNKLEGRVPEPAASEDLRPIAGELLRQMQTAGWIEMNKPKRNWEELVDWLAERLAPGLVAVRVDAEPAAQQESERKYVDDSPLTTERIRVLREQAWDADAGVKPRDLYMKVAKGEMQRLLAEVETSRRASTPAKPR